MDAISNGVKRSGIVVTIGVVTGVLAGWWGIIRADAVEQMVVQSGPAILLLVILLPLTLALSQFINVSEQEMPYQNLMATRIEFIVGGFLGSVGGSILFVVAAFQIAAVFGGVDPAAMMDALRPYLFDNAILVVGVTTISGFIVAQWAHLRVIRQLD
jgi:hypothetical protein